MQAVVGKRSGQLGWDRLAAVGGQVDGELLVGGRVGCCGCLVDTSARVGGIEGGGIFGAGLQVIEELLDGFEGGFDAGVEEGDGNLEAEEVDVRVGVFTGYCFDRRVRVDGISIPSGGGGVADEGGHFG